MGLFILNMKDTLEDDISSAIANLELFQQEYQKGNIYPHLLTFAEHCIKSADDRLSDGGDQDFDGR